MLTGERWSCVDWSSDTPASREVGASQRGSWSSRSRLMGDSHVSLRDTGPCSHSVTRTGGWAAGWAHRGPWGPHVCELASVAKGQGHAQ